MTPMTHQVALSGDGRDMHPSPEAKTLTRIRAHEEERLLARSIVSDLVTLGSSAELLERSRLFLESYPD
jgi:hypothetical protein